MTLFLAGTIAQKWFQGLVRQPVNSCQNLHTFSLVNSSLIISQRDDTIVGIDYTIDVPVCFSQVVGKPFIPPLKKGVRIPLAFTAVLEPLPASTRTQISSSNCHCSIYHLHHTTNASQRALL
jgi:hypothetical protein